MVSHHKLGQLPLPNDRSKNQKSASELSSEGRGVLLTFRRRARLEIDRKSVWQRLMRDRIARRTSASIQNGTRPTRLGGQKMLDMATEIDAATAETQKAHIGREAAVQFHDGINVCLDVFIQRHFVLLLNYY